MFDFLNIAYLTILLHIICVLRCQGEETLQLVHVIFRHGNRTPDSRGSYPNDPYRNDSYYPYGDGQLTNKGKNKMYILGKALRERYDRFLGPLYTPNILDPVSTQMNRTKMSLELVLAGLFPPHGTDLEWQKELNWQPIPYNYASFFSDNTLSIPFMTCPKYIELLRSLDGSSKGIAFRKRYTGLYKRFTDHSGTDNVSSLLIITTYATLTAQEDFSLMLPSWTEPIYPKQLEEFSGDFFEYITSTEELRQLSGGFLLRKIICDTVAKLDNYIKPPGRKMFLYSAHDINVVYILGAMNVYFPHYPPYGACVMIEVHKIDNVPGIKIFYQDYTHAEPKILKVPGCDYFCPLKQFVRLLKNNQPTSDYQCKTDSSSHRNEL